MNIEKFYKRKARRDLSKAFLSRLKAERILLNRRREFFSPKKQLLQVKKAWQEKNRSSFIKKLNILMFSTLIYWFLPGWFIIAISRILLSKKIRQLTVRKIQFEISEYRLAIRYTIISKPLNLITIVSILPFFVGFFDFLHQNQQLKKTLFHKNIPAFNIPTESMSWETFRYFTESKKDFLVESEKIQWSSNSLFLTKTVNKELFDQDYFIASFTTNSDTIESLLLYTGSTKNDLSNSSKFSSGLESDCLVPVNDKNQLFLSKDRQNFGSNRIYLNLIEKQTSFSGKKTQAFKFR